MGFSSQVSLFAKDVDRLLIAMFRTSAQYLAEEIVDKVPVDTGFLRNSFMVSLNRLPTIGDEGTGRDGIASAISKATTADSIYLSFTAEYAMRIEYGFDGMDVSGRLYNQSGRFMVRGAAQNWKTHVAKAFKDAGGSP